MSDPAKVSADLATKIKTDPQVRAQFIADMKGVLGKHGIDTDNEALMDHFGVTEKALAGPAVAMSSFVITITA